MNATLYDYSEASTRQCVPNEPVWLHIRNTPLFNFYRRFLMLRTLSVFDVKLPNEWNINYFLYTLFVWGWIGVFKHPKYGVICQGSTLSGYGIYYQPTRQIFTNPNWGYGIETTIGTSSALLQLTPDYMGFLPTIDIYAGRLAIASGGLDINLLNSRLAYVVAAATDAGAKSFKKAFDKIYAGEPMVVFDKSLSAAFENGGTPWEYFSQDLRSNFIAPDIIDSMRAIMNDFDSLIGITNSNTDKKERLLTDEVNANNQETQSLPDLMVQTLNIGIKQVKEMYGLDVTIKKRGDKYESNNTDSSKLSAGTISKGNS